VISFNLSRRVRELPWHKPDTLSADDLYFRYRLDAHASAGEYGNFVALMRGFKKFISYLEPGGTVNGSFKLEPGDWLIVYDFFHNKTAVAQAAGGPGKLTIERNEDGWSGLPDEVASGDVDMTVVHPGKRRTGVLVFAHPDHPPLTLSLGNYLSGNRLINNQTFRTLYRAETLASGEGIGVRDLTLLFTDLKGSTELYERVGDLEAFSLVQQHFEHLRRAVQEQEGAVIKTIGDAVMASFVRPEQAVRAALAMFREIEDFNRARGKRELILKVGMHRGHSIAVTLNERLDYFGQTVNLAARVQGVANADEICLTEEVYKTREVQAALKGMPTTSESPRLKGIADEVPIRRVQVARA
jgi:class 3 adenylate cyclase